jgi:anti-sigma regulatory factor (Ser/Thr protein kinase)
VRGIPRFTPDEILQRSFSADTDAPRRAREMVNELQHPLDERRRADLYVTTSELVTNAVLHGPPGDIGVRLIVTATRARVEVSDPGIDPFDWPTPRASAEETGGWGLHLVASVSDELGVDRRPHTVVWCEFDLDVPPGSLPAYGTGNS